MEIALLFPAESLGFEHSLRLEQGAIRGLLRGRVTDYVQNKDALRLTSLGQGLIRAAGLTKKKNLPHVCRQLVLLEMEGKALQERRHAHACGIFLAQLSKSSWLDIPSTMQELLDHPFLLDDPSVMTQLQSALKYRAFQSDYFVQAVRKNNLQLCSFLLSVGAREGADQFFSFLSSQPKLLNNSAFMASVKVAMEGQCYFSYFFEKKDLTNCRLLNSLGIPRPFICDLKLLEDVEMIKILKSLHEGAIPYDYFDYAVRYQNVKVCQNLILHKAIVDPESVLCWLKTSPNLLQNAELMREVSAALKGERIDPWFFASASASGSIQLCQLLVSCGVKANLSSAVSRLALELESDTPQRRAQFSERFADMIVYLKALLKDQLNASDNSATGDRVLTPLSHAILRKEPEDCWLLKLLGADENLAIQKIKEQELRAIMGIDCDGMSAVYGKALLSRYWHLFCTSQSRVCEQRGLTQQNALAIQETIDSTIIVTNREISDPEKSALLKKIKSGATVVLSSGSEAHTVYVKCKGNSLFFGNRGNGSVGPYGIIGCALPEDQINEQLINQLTKRYADMDEFSRIMLNPLLGHIAHSVEMKGQDTGNCVWASAKTLVRMELEDALGAEKAYTLYKEFTHFARERAIAEYREMSPRNVPNPLLKQAIAKLANKDQKKKKTGTCCCIQ